AELVELGASVVCATDVLVEGAGLRYLAPDTGKVEITDRQGRGQTVRDPAAAQLGRQEVLVRAAERRTRYTRAEVEIRVEDRERTGRAENIESVLLHVVVTDRDTVEVEVIPEQQIGCPERILGPAQGDLPARMREQADIAAIHPGRILREVISQSLV